MRAPSRINGVNRASPLSRGLIVSLPFGTVTRCLITGDFITSPTSDVIPTLSVLGENPSSETNGGYQISSTQKVTTGISMSWWQYTPSLPSSGKYWSAGHGGHAGTDNAGLTWWLGAGSSGDMFFVAGDSLGGSSINRRSRDKTAVVTAGELAHFVVTTPGGSAFPTVYKNGEILLGTSTAGTASALGYESTSYTGAHGRATGNAVYETPSWVLFGYNVWGRVLGASEARALYNPQTRWDIYDQDYQLIPVGIAAASDVDTEVSAALATHNWSPFSSTVAVDVEVSANLATHNWTPVSSGVSADVEISANLATHNWSATPSTVDADVTVSANLATHNWSATAGTVSADVGVLTNLATHNWAPAAAGISADVAIAATLAVQTWTPAGAEIGLDTDVAANLATHDWTALAASVQSGQDVQAVTVLVEWSSFLANASADTAVDATSFGMTWSPVVATVDANTSVTAQAATLTWNGAQATASANTEVAATSQTQNWGSFQATVTSGAAINADFAVIDWTGQAATVATGSEVPAAVFDMRWTAFSATVLDGARVQATTATHNWTAFPAEQFVNATSARAIWFGFRANIFPSSVSDSRGIVGGITGSPVAPTTGDLTGEF